MHACRAGKAAAFIRGKHSLDSYHEVNQKAAKFNLRNAAQADDGDFQGQDHLASSSLEWLRGLVLDLVGTREGQVDDQDGLLLA